MSFGYLEFWELLILCLMDSYIIGGRCRLVMEYIEFELGGREVDNFFNRIINSFLVRLELLSVN